MTKKLVSLLVTLMMLLSSTAFATGNEWVSNSAYRLTDEPVSYTWVIVSDRISDPNESCVFFQKMEEMTGVHFDFKVLSSQDAATQFTLLWANHEDLPDIISGYDIKDAVKYSQYGLFFPINTLLDTCMPNFNAALNAEENAGLREQLTFEDGNMYCLPAIESNNAPYNGGFYINQDWLDHLGLEVPTTTEELFDVLVAFKENDANNNGDVNDEIPFASNAFPVVYGWFGAATDGMTVKNGKAVFDPTTEEWKEAIKYLNKLWENGLMDPEHFTQESASFNAKGRLDNSIYGSIATTRLAWVADEAKRDEYTLLPALDGGTGTYGGVLWRPNTASWFFNRAIISADVENPEILLKWMDILYDPFYGVQASQGPLGWITTVDEEGQFLTLTEPAEGYASVVEMKDLSHYNQIPNYTNWSVATNLWLNSWGSEENVLYKEIYNYEAVNEVMVNNIQTVEEIETLAQYADLNKFVSDNVALFIVGEKDIDAEWDDFQAELIRLSCEEYEEDYQRYFDRVMK